MANELKPWLQSAIDREVRAIYDWKRLTHETKEATGSEPRRPALFQDSGRVIWIQNSSKLGRCNVQAIEVRSSLDFSIEH